MRAVDKTTVAFIRSYLGDIIYPVYNFTTINNENAGCIVPASPATPRPSLPSDSRSIAVLER